MARSTWCSTSSATSPPERLTIAPPTVRCVMPRRHVRPCPRPDRAAPASRLQSRTTWHNPETGDHHAIIDPAKYHRISRRPATDLGPEVRTPAVRQPGRREVCRQHSTRTTRRRVRRVAPENRDCGRLAVQSRRRITVGADGRRVGRCATADLRATVRATPAEQSTSASKFLRVLTTERVTRPTASFTAIDNPGGKRG
jgi:hypothetical protein